MNSRYKPFSISVMIAVILVGAGFGTWTGLVYNPTLWWIATIAGGLCGYPLARIYLRSLKNSCDKGHGGPVIWVSGTFVATGCGIACTALLHAIMIMVTAYGSNVASLGELGDSRDIWPIVFFVGVVIGAGAGFLVGGICSLVFVLSVKAPVHETA
ncbi:MAG: hypothetical protein ACQESR_27320 [Planctomycetota bacterium]